MRIAGDVTRLVPGEDGGPDLVFFNPDPGTDLRFVDTKHRRASGEMVVEAPLEGRQIGEHIECELDGEVLALVKGGR